MNGGITILDYGVGNLLSIKNMLKKGGVDNVVITNDTQTVAKAGKIILPGVGHFDYGMKKLKSAPFFDVLEKKALEERVPVLGICLGAQLLTNSSEEGIENGLGWIDAETVKFAVERFEKKLPIPHMGWAEVKFNRNPLFEGMFENSRFYFVHSYFLKPKHTEDILCESFYGHSFASGIVSGNIYGVQFHPEKSHKFGLKLLENFAKI